MWTGQLFTFFLVVLGAELVVFLGFLGWLILGLRRRDRMDRDAEAFRESLHEAFAGGADEDAVETFEQLAGNHPDEVVQEVVLELIRESEPPIDVEMLVDAYRATGFVDEHLRRLESNARSTRTRALRALVGVARSRDLSAIRESLTDYNVERMLAGKIAVDVGTPEDVFEIFREVQLESRLMEEPVYAVLESMEPDAFEEVFAGWGKIDSPGMKRVLLRVAAELDADGCLEAIRVAAQSQHLELRTAACDAAADLEDPETLELLRRLLRDDHPAVRARAATALGDQGDESAIEELQRTMTDPEFWVRQNAAASLRRLGPPGLRALQEVIDLADDRYAVDAARQEIDRHEHRPTASRGSR